MSYRKIFYFLGSAILFCFIIVLQPSMIMARDLSLTEFKRIYNTYRIASVENKNVNPFPEFEARPFTGSSPNTVQTDTWIYSAHAKTSQKRNEVTGRTHFDAFWDVSPRAFFLTLTDFIGNDKTGLWMDSETNGVRDAKRYIVGYRILPFEEKETLQPIQKEGRSIYPLLVKMKVYWSQPVWNQKNGVQKIQFDLSKTNDLPQIEKDFSGTVIEFQLFFDEPVVFDISSKGELGFYKIESIGNILGYGIWNYLAQGDLGEAMVKNIEISHPDQLWSGRTRNIKHFSGVIENTQKESKSLNLRVGLKGFYIQKPVDEGAPLSLETVMKRIQFILTREEIQNQVFLEDILYDSKNKEFFVNVRNIEGVNIENLRKVFERSGLDIRKMDLVLKSKI